MAAKGYYQYYKKHFYEIMKRGSTKRKAAVVFYLAGHFFRPRRSRSDAY